MNPELREAIGKVLYNASYMEFNHDWTMLTDEDREDWMQRAEKVVEAFIAPFLPRIIILGKELIKNNPSMKDTINDVFHQATGRDLDNEP
jgi:hypothetical protein